MTVTIPTTGGEALVVRRAFVPQCARCGVWLVDTDGNPCWDLLSEPIGELAFVCPSRCRGKYQRRPRSGVRGL